MVTLNHGIAAARVHGPSKSLELSRTLDTDARLAGHYRLDAVRAHLLQMVGDYESAIEHHRIAAGRRASQNTRGPDKKIAAPLHQHDPTL
jgi:predicted RNA polymerase sigma factor